jgi:hypothetical protein
MTSRRISLIKEHARYVIFCKKVKVFVRAANKITVTTVKECDDKIVVIRDMFTYMDRYNYVWLGKTNRILDSLNHIASKKLIEIMGWGYDMSKYIKKFGFDNVCRYQSENKPVDGKSMRRPFCKEVPVAGKTSCKYHLAIENCAISDIQSITRIPERELSRGVYEYAFDPDMCYTPVTHNLTFECDTYKILEGW